MPYKKLIVHVGFIELIMLIMNINDAKQKILLHTSC